MTKKRTAAERRAPGFLTETIAYREMMRVPWSACSYSPTMPRRRRPAIWPPKRKRKRRSELDEIIRQAEELKKAQKLKADADAFISGQLAPAEGSGPDYTGLNNLLVLDGGVTRRRSKRLPIRRKSSRR